MAIWYDIPVSLVRRLILGSTSVLASVNGPIEVRLRDEQVDKATLEVVFRPADKMAGTSEKVLEKLIRDTFGSAIMTNLNPRTLIQIVVQVEHDDGGVRLGHPGRYILTIRSLLHL